MVLGVGVDCAMILVAVYAGNSAVPAGFDPRPYPSDWHLHRSEERYLGWLREFADEVTEGPPQPADVAIWKFGRAFSHAAIVTSEAGRIIHAYKDAGEVVRGHLDETTLADRQRLVFRVRGVA